MACHKWRLAPALLVASCVPANAPTKDDAEPVANMEAVSALVPSIMPDVVNVYDISHAFVENEIAAAKKYGGRPLLIRGEVSSVEDGPEARIFLESELSTFSALVADKEAASRLMSGHVVLLLCTNVERDVVLTRALGCEIVSER